MIETDKFKGQGDSSPFLEPVSERLPPLLELTELTGYPRDAFKLDAAEWKLVSGRSDLVLDSTRRDLSGQFLLTVTRAFIQEIKPSGDCLTNGTSHEVRHKELQRALSFSLRDLQICCRCFAIWQRHADQDVHRILSWDSACASAWIEKRYNDSKAKVGQDLLLSIADLAQERAFEIFSSREDVMPPSLTLTGAIERTGNRLNTESGSDQIILSRLKTAIELAEDLWAVQHSIRALHYVNADPLVTGIIQRERIGFYKKEAFELVIKELEEMEPDSIKLRKAFKTQVANLSIIFERQFEATRRIIAFMHQFL